MKLRNLIAGACALGWFAAMVMSASAAEQITTNRVTNLSLQAGAILSANTHYV